MKDAKTIFNLCMSELSLTVAGIQSKIEKIAQLHERVKDENFKLVAEKEDLLKTVESKKKMINNLEERTKILRLAKSLSGVNESSLDTKLKINELVREIDKCIALLNR